MVTLFAQKMLNFYSLRIRVKYIEKRIKIDQRILGFDL